jgi:hypothetical protein
MFTKLSGPVKEELIKHRPAYIPPYIKATNSFIPALKKLWNIPSSNLPKTEEKNISMYMAELRAKRNNRLRQMESPKPKPVNIIMLLTERFLLQLQV